MPAADLDAPPWTLTALVVVAAGQCVIEWWLVAEHETVQPVARVLLGAVVAGKVGFAILARRRSAAGALAVLLYEGVVLLTALAGGATPLRVALLATAIAATALLITSLRAFPTPEIP